MSSNSSLDKRENKNFVINNKYFLKQYALKNRDLFGNGVIVINLLLLKTDIVSEQNIPNYEIEDDKELTIHQAISYIPQNNFWFKMLNLKIKKKYQIDIQEKDSTDNKTLVIFVKDASVEHFSIYSLKL
ncbi:hypothetical protein I4641_11010 [Waterburya agarophytonicola K14]|uniref:Uncharacterized protein n=1 Tax=Waterburya agarophytonicola KI4 TaxID=2874699 RepID=A0A964FFW4_9CYAN|nr:hypothetical protein [Waterburya agarophytonicola]MCC0177507.1 hypothetical protein [Waterburya agarophytonicola KI4]